MDILEEKEAFLNVYVNYKGDSRKISFNEETEQFMWRKNNVSDTEVEYVHLMNQQWYAWLACAKSKVQAVPEGYILIPKKMPDEVNDHLWDFMTDNFVCTNDYGDSFMACDDFNLDKFYAELVKAQEPAND
ncbi:hypothetical protein [Acinetobacter lwoffii]|jgi:hypothetical protein|uniref:hypothetical protein n=1 Tax=Acinetobacter lwoffii TaxID=28090 RepID=UPI003F900C18